MEVFKFFIFWIIKCSPFAIVSLIAKAIGQQEDIEFENRGKVTEDDYIAMIEGKTSAMFERHVLGQEQFCLMLKKEQLKIWQTGD